MEKQNHQTRLKLNYLLSTVLSIYTLISFFPLLPMLSKILSTTLFNVSAFQFLYLFSYGLSLLITSLLLYRYKAASLQIIYLIIALAGAVLGFMTWSFLELMISRCLLGIGIGGNIILIRFIASHIFNKTEIFTKTLSMNAIFVGLVTGLSPIVTLWINHTIGWQYINLFLCFLIILSLLSSNYHIKINRVIKKETLFKKEILLDYLMPLKEKRFIVYPAMMSIIFSGFIIYFTMIPHILTTSLHASIMINNLIYSLIGFSIMIGALFNLYLLDRYRHNTIFIFSGIGFFILSIIQFILALSIESTIFTIVLPFFLYCIFAQLVYPNALAIGLSTGKNIHLKTNILVTLYLSSNNILSGLIAGSLFFLHRAKTNLTMTIALPILILTTIYLILSMLVSRKS